MPLTPQIARSFRLELQEARESAFKDGEAFDEVIHAIERLGRFLDPDQIGMARLERALKRTVATKSALATDVPSKHRRFHMPFSVLYRKVTAARNDAVHIGAVARHLTRNAIALALILEDGLRFIEDPKLINDYMIRDPVCAELWEPISHIRQKMLANSFSFLPVNIADGKWSLVSEFQIAQLLTVQSPTDSTPVTPDIRKDRLKSSLLDSGISLNPVNPLRGTLPIAKAIGALSSGPVLVVREGDGNCLEGILTTFDLI